MLEDEARQISGAQEDPVLFGPLFDRYYPQILNYAIRRVGDVHIAEDIAAEVFLKALKNIRTYTWQGIPFSAWLYRIAGNEIYSYFRRKKVMPWQQDGHHGLFDKALSEVDLEAELASAEERLAQHQLFLAVQREVRRLASKYQEVVVLRYFEHKKIGEIAIIVNKRPGTVKSLLSRGTTQLRAALAVQPFQNEGVIPYMSKKQAKDVKAKQ